MTGYVIELYEQPDAAAMLTAVQKAVALHQCSRDDCLICAPEEILRERGLSYSLSSHEPETDLLCTDYEKLRHGGE